MSEIEISDDRARIDVDLVHQWLGTSYWAAEMSRETFERAIAGSHCVTAWRDGVQVGFARAVTDRATYAYITDVWVDEAARGQGVGRAMVGWLVARPEYKAMRRITLQTADAHGVYAALGFEPVLGPERWMEIPSAQARAMVAKDA